jgi:hypothetical protein
MQLKRTMLIELLHIPDLHIDREALTNEYYLYHESPLSSWIATNNYFESSRIAVCSFREFVQPFFYLKERQIFIEVILILGYTRKN